MIQRRNIALLPILSLLLVPSCKKKQARPDSVLPVAPPVVTLPEPVKEEPKEKPVYVYSGDRFRDPFTPAGQATNYQPDAVFDPQRASLKGIIFGHDLKSAVLIVGGSGSYFVRSGRIFDIMGKTVEGYSAKVFVDKVLVLGEADNIFELKIRNNDEEEKSL